MDSTLALRQYADLPGPRGLPLLGNALQIKSARFHRQLEGWAEQFGPLFKLQLGRRPVLVVGAHSEVAAILRDRPEGFRRTSRLEQIWTELGLPNGVFGANGEAWRAQRRMVMAGFDPAHVRHYYPSMQRVAARLVERWQVAAAAGSAIDLQADLMRYTVDTIAGLAFGVEVNTLASDEDVIQRHLDQLFPAIFKRALAPLAWWRIWPSAADRRLAASIVEINKAVAGFIAQARAALLAEPALRGQPANLLQAMLVAADAPGSGIRDAHVAGNVLTMLLAGEDTTANTLAWLIHLLWRHPQALARVQAELKERLPAQGEPGMDDLAGLDYLEACIHETMRLKPVAPILPLQTERATRVGDVMLPAGTVVICLMRRDSLSEQQLPHATQFQPERWLVAGGPASLATSAKRVSMPFGAGPRICPGRYLALLEMKLAMATLLSHFEIAAVDAPDGAEAAEHLAFTMAPLGLQMRLRVPSQARPAQAGAL